MLLLGSKVVRPSPCSWSACRRLQTPKQPICSRLRDEQEFMAGVAGPGSVAVAATSSSGPTSQGADRDSQDPIVQWVVLRRDLWTDLGWPLGPVIAQACHASSAAMFEHLDDALTQEYTAAGNIDHMHKVVLEVKSQQQLENLSSKLQEQGVLHKLWIEQPENYPTCLATKPYRRSQAAPVFKKYQLCKAVLAAKQ